MDIDGAIDVILCELNVSHLGPKDSLSLVHRGKFLVVTLSLVKRQGRNVTHHLFVRKAGAFRQVRIASLSESQRNKLVLGISKINELVHYLPLLFNMSRQQIYQVIDSHKHKDQSCLSTSKRCSPSR